MKKPDISVDVFAKFPNKPSYEQRDIFIRLQDEYINYLESKVKNINNDALLETVKNNEWKTVFTLEERPIHTEQGFLNIPDDTVVAFDKMKYKVFATGMIIESKKLIKYMNLNF